MKKAKLFQSRGPKPSCLIMEYKGKFYKVDHRDLSAGTWSDLGYSYLEDNSRTELRNLLLTIAKAADSACPPDTLPNLAGTHVQHHYFMIPQAGSNSN